MFSEDHKLAINIPLFYKQLLLPHFRFTLARNIGGRPGLFGPSGPLNMVWSIHIVCTVYYIRLYSMTNHTKG